MGASGLADGIRRREVFRRGGSSGSATNLRGTRAGHRFHPRRGRTRSKTRQPVRRSSPARRHPRWSSAGRDILKHILRGTAGRAGDWDAAGLDYVSGGRSTLGPRARQRVAAGCFEGFPRRAVTARFRGRTREVVEICRAVWRRRADCSYRGEALPHAALDEGSHGGTGLGKGPLKITTTRSGKPDPDRAGRASGRKNVALAAEIGAEGLGSRSSVYPERGRETFRRPSLDGGRDQARTRSWPPLQIVVDTRWAINWGTPGGGCGRGRWRRSAPRLGPLRGRGGAWVPPRPTTSTTTSAVAVGYGETAAAQCRGRLYLRRGGCMRSRGTHA